MANDSNEQVATAQGHQGENDYYDGTTNPSFPPPSFPSYPPYMPPATPGPYPPPMPAPMVMPGPFHYYPRPYPVPVRQTGNKNTLPIILAIIVVIIALIIIVPYVIFFIWISDDWDDFDDTETPKGHMTINGNSDSYFRVNVQTMDGELFISESEYFLVSPDGTTVLFGRVSDINGLNWEDDDVNLSFKDNDMDGRITPEDQFSLRGTGNGGRCCSGYTFLIKFSENDELVMVQNTP